MSESLIDEKQYIKGELIHLIFHNAETLYTVAKIKVLETTYTLEEKTVTVVGTMPPIESDTTYLFYGYFTEHPRFGKQYKVEQVKKVMPETRQGIILYLSSDRFPGIGKKTAEKIVTTLGESAISKIIEDKGALEKVPGLKKDVAQNLYEKLLEDQGIEQVFIRLYEYGFGLQLAVKVYQTYKLDALDIIENNPYQMVEDVEGIGFTKADMIGRKQGITGSHPDRIKAGIIYVMNEQCLSEGHVFIENETLIVKTKQLLEENSDDEIEPIQIANQIIVLVEESKLVVEEERAYIPSLYFAEKGIVSNIHRLMNGGELDIYPDAEFYKALGKVEEMLNISYAPSQQEAIKKAISSPMMILTGGPGTGKTTVIKGLIEVFSELKGVSVRLDNYKKDDIFPILMAAPTGRAAKRLSESTDLPASTIHRLLGYNGADESFEYDEQKQLEGELLIIDEMSMVDTWLANQLLKAVPTGMQVIFVGDEDQLPSVGPGQVFSDLLSSNLIPVAKLTDIFRQSDGSKIIEFSHEIKNGQKLAPIDFKNNDLRFFSCTQQQVPNVIEQICKKAIERGFSAKDIQVLAPMYRGIAGVDNLNKMLQQLFNPPSEKKREVPYGDVVYRSGDVVLQLVNNPEENVFNGDRGEIVAIFTEKENVDREVKIVVSYDGIEVTYTKQELNQITHAYCCSIHKSQGSEFPMVIMPIVRGYYRMLRRKLIYTGVTRAKDYLLLCGEWEWLQYAVHNDEDVKRNTTLREKLNQILQYEKEGATKD